MALSATINLLTASLVVAISGGLRVYVAFLLSGKNVNISIPLVMILIVYSTYTLDRTINCAEDEINRTEESNANKFFPYFLLCICLLCAILILIQNRIFPLIALFPIIMGFMYTKGFKIGDFSIKLKKGRGIKNFFVAFTWALTIIFLIYPADNLSLFLIFILFFIKSFINTVIFDFKDIKGDSRAGLKTIPVYFGELKAKLLLHLIQSSFHIVLIVLAIFGLIKFELFILFYSWIGGIIYILLYANSKKTIFRGIVVHGEWAHMLIFRSLVI
ncbi:MAG: UbiA family prenyltransferase [Candidatus Methanoperedens sp.]|uniref:UbiA family prenyltransferase n=1 Tax=Candidatus Methanoperedens sp. BLZ2 TaxID=2035255 RepID=UPI001596D932|nr:UbiA family prenyltransferase [Candidatus Methanoperedens sp. BLZ2]MBZ0177568.1 UbiA family prenyltransferase [Candidatus Methanoperedens nitroreducens]MCX9086223.1 UbiA family prenyltransferase [Candidatus Methanoperedens sp.]